jgi:hypothetical protein
MEKLYSCFVPSTFHMSECRIVARSTPMETKVQCALRDYNNQREREGLRPLNRMPKGTTYTVIEGT